MGAPAAAPAPAGGPVVGPAEAVAAGLPETDYAEIERLLGRPPNATELGMFAAMWSEHCSYRSSRPHLARFPTESPRVVEGPGENAGAVAIGEGLAAVFKVESHNHPTFIEPYQGAATGVGGILRDIFTMGARPVALMNSLRFGPLSNRENRRLFAGAVAGIANYGNSMGIPTVGGEVAFEDCHTLNPLVNAFALGLAPADRLFRARADEPGHPVYCVGAKTGRDGIHGAAMASAEFDEEAESKRPTVQVGDPFLEKLLMEACLELMRGDSLVAVQDMGAAGLTCSTSEIAAKGGCGVRVDLDRVPQRETGMSAYEIMLSESQERMLLVVRRGREAEVERVFAKWDLDAAALGEITGDGLLRVRHAGETAAEVPCRALTEGAPPSDRPLAAPASWPPPEVTAAALDEPKDWNEVALRLAAAPGLCSRRWVYEQYDHMVRSDTLARPGADAGVVRIEGSRLGVAMTLDGNGRTAGADPRRGGALAVSEACRNLAAVGATPVGATNCLNFGSPEKPEVRWQFSEVITGMSEALSAFGVPITGGNVSFYNETDGAGILPTPVVGVVGVLEDTATLVGQHYRGRGDAVYLVGAPLEGVSSDGEASDGEAPLGGSEYLKVIHGRTDGRPPAPALEAEVRLGAFLRAAAAAGLLRSAKDLSEGGLFQAAVEGMFAPDGSRLGLSLALEVGSRIEGALFGEAPARALVSVTPEDRDALHALAEKHAVPAKMVGLTGGDRFEVRVNRRRVIHLAVDALWDAFGRGLERALSEPGP